MDTFVWSSISCRGYTTLSPPTFVYIDKEVLLCFANTILPHLKMFGGLATAYSRRSLSSESAGRVVGFNVHSVSCGFKCLQVHLDPDLNSACRTTVCMFTY
ncbi:unnamed protein product [Cercospora beticola]|nr:unnamed protein product [Cercospora beticola]